MIKPSINLFLLLLFLQLFNLLQRWSGTPYPVNDVHEEPEDDINHDISEHDSPPLILVNTPSPSSVTEGWSLCS